MHVDDFIDSFESDAYAAFVLHHMRLPATLKHKFAPFTKERLLFCTYEGARYRVTGASCRGDVWLAKDPSRDTGYDLRVAVDTCSEWGGAP